MNMHTYKNYIYDIKESIWGLPNYEEVLKSEIHIEAVLSFVSKQLGLTIDSDIEIAKETISEDFEKINSKYF